MTSFTPLDQIIFDDTQNKLLFMTRTMKQAVIGVINTENAQFNDDVSRFEKNIVSIITENTIHTSIITLFTSFEKVATLPLDRFKLGEALFGFGKDDSVVPFSDAQNANNLIINTVVRQNGLSLSLNYIARIDYETRDELDALNKKVNEEYTDLIEIQPNLDAKLKLTDLKSAVDKKIGELELLSVVTVFVKTKTPAAVLSYQFYGTTEKAGIICQLNDCLFTGFLQGDIKVLANVPNV